MSDVAPGSSPVDSSTALANMSQPERDHWQLTGEMPADTPQTESPESSPAAPDVQAVSTETLPPASEPGTSTHATPTLAKRHAELDADIASLKEKLALKRQLEGESRVEPVPQRPQPVDVPAASSPATEIPLDRLITSPDLTKAPLDETEFFSRYPDASIGQLIRYQTRYELLRTQAEQSFQQGRQSTVQTYAKALETEIAANPAFVSELHPRVAALQPTDALPPGVQPGPLNLVAQLVIENPESSIRMLKHLSEHPDLLDKLSTASPKEIIRTMGRIEGLVSSVSPAVVQTTTSAPRPAPTLGTKPTVATPEPEAALNAGDFRRYMTAKNRQEVAS